MLRQGWPSVLFILSIGLLTAGCGDLADKNGDGRGISADTDNPHVYYGIEEVTAAEDNLRANQQLNELNASGNYLFAAQVTQVKITDPTKILEAETVNEIFDDARFIPYAELLGPNGHLAMKAFKFELNEDPTKPYFARAYAHKRTERPDVDGQSNYGDYFIITVFTKGQDAEFIHFKETGKLSTETGKP